MAVNASAFYGTGIYGESEYGVINAEFAVTGVAGTGAVTTVSVTGDANFSTPSVSASATTDPDVVITADAVHSITSVQGVGAASTVGIVGVAIHQVDGVEGTGENTAPTVSGDANFAIPAGVEGTMFNGGAEGRPSTVVQASDYGGGFELTGTVNATLGFIGEANTTPEEAEATGSVTTAVISGDANFDLPESVEGTGEVTTSGVSAAASAGVTGVEGTGAATTATITSRYLTQSVEGTGEVTTVTLACDSNLSLSSVSATIITDQPDVVTDDITVDADANTAVTGVEATGAVTTVNIFENAEPTFDSVSATSAVGTLTVSATQNVFSVANRNARRVAKVPPAPPRIVYVGRAA